MSTSVHVHEFSSLGNRYMYKTITSRLRQCTCMNFRRLATVTCIKQSPRGAMGVNNRGDVWCNILSLWEYECSDK